MVPLFGTHFGSWTEDIIVYLNQFQMLFHALVRGIAARNIGGNKIQIFLVLLNLQ